MTSLHRSICLARLLAIAIFLTLTVASLSQAQTQPASVKGDRTLELVDHLKELIHSAERDQRSSFWLTRQLRDLVRQYDWPWRVSLLHDDFLDGDYTYNPRWVVSNGEFWVTRDSTLRSVFDLSPPARRLSDRRNEIPAIEILQEVLWGGSRSEQAETQPNSQSPAEIYTRLPISNAFAVKLKLIFHGTPYSGKRFEFGPYQGEERDWGYQLAYESGKVPFFKLLRAAPGRSAVIEIYDRGVDLEDGNSHTVEWRRDHNGEMVVLLDDKEIMRSVDRAYSGSFDGFRLVNKGGVYELQDIFIFGAN